jgi:hypothetical protein
VDDQANLTPAQQDMVIASTLRKHKGEVRVASCAWQKKHGEIAPEKIKQCHLYLGGKENS